MGQAKRRRDLDPTWGRPLLYDAFYFGSDAQQLFMVTVQVPRRSCEIDQDTAAVRVGQLLHWATMYRDSSDARDRAMQRLGFDAEEWGQFTELCDEWLPADAWCMELWPPGPDALAVYAGYGGTDLDRAKALRGHVGKLHQTDERTAGVGVGVVR